MMQLRKRQVISAILVAACMLGVLFALQFFRLSQKFGPPPTHIELTDPSLIRGWMSAEYVSAAYKIPLSVLQQELNLKPGQERIPLKALQRERDDQPLLVERVQEIVQAAQKLREGKP